MSQAGSNSGGGGGGGGTVTGTGTDKHIVRWDGTGVPVIQDSDPIIEDNGQLQLVDGTNAIPALSWITETDSGFYRLINRNFGFSLGGVTYFNWSIDGIFGKYTTDSFESTNTAKFAGAQVINVRQTAISVAALDQDYLIEVTDTSAPRTITLGNAARQNQVFIVKDSSGAAATNPITVTVSGGVKTIDGQTSVLINTNYGAIAMYADSSSNYHVLWKYSGSNSGFPWLEISTATQTIAVNTGYITNRGAGVTYTLPITASQGDIIKISGKLGLWTIAQNANQSIAVASSTSTVGVGGSVAATNVGDCIELLCITGGTSTVWRAQDYIGNLTVT